MCSGTDTYLGGEWHIAREGDVHGRLCIGDPLAAVEPLGGAGKGDEDEAGEAAQKQRLAHRCGVCGVGREGKGCEEVTWLEEAYM